MHLDPHLGLVRVVLAQPMIEGVGIHEFPYLVRIDVHWPVSLSCPIMLKMRVT